MKTTTMIKEIEKRMVAVGKERDKIDEIIGNATDLKESCERAYDALQEARDALSELV